MSNNISVIGIGRLGLCMSLVLENVGYNVMGVDTISDYVTKINDKTLVSNEPNVTSMLIKSKNFKATTHLEEAVNHSDLILIYVSTPSTGNDKQYDHSTLGKVLLEINKLRVKNKHIVIGCTVMPGYIRDIANFLIKDCEKCTVSYNPEFIAQGNIIKGLLSPDFVLIGEGSKQAGDTIEQMYKKINSPLVIKRMSPISAEITKLSVNCFVTTKIAFANMIGDVADKTDGANKYDILDAVGYDSRIGDKYLRPGYGFGGPCFPRDNKALGAYIHKLGIQPLIPYATDESNYLHNIFQSETMFKYIKNNDIKEFIIEGAGYKEPCVVPIIEESPKLKMAEFLAHKGVHIIIRDIKPLIECTKLEYGNLFSYEEVETLSYPIY